MQCGNPITPNVSNVLVFLLSEILDGFVLLLKTRMRGYDVRRMELQRQGMLPKR